MSVRTVRNWLHEAEEALDGAASITSVRGVYTLTIRSRTRFERLTAVGNSIWSRTPTTSDRRVAYLLSNLLFRNDWVTIDALADDLPQCQSHEKCIRWRLQPPRCSATVRTRMAGTKV